MVVVVVVVVTVVLVVVVAAVVVVEEVVVIHKGFFFIFGAWKLVGKTSWIELVGLFQSKKQLKVITGHRFFSVFFPFFWYIFPFCLV